jgi:hypothetical protein
MGAYLSVDLDFWMNHENTRDAYIFFKQVFNLPVPITLVIEHEELIPDVNKLQDITTLYNVDYHSDIVDWKHAIKDMKEPQDYDWVNFVRGKTKAEFVWVLPQEECYYKEEGVCHGNEDSDPFRYQTSRWKQTRFTDNLYEIEWKQIERVGVCLSPLFVETKPIRNVLDMFDMNEKQLKTLQRKAARAPSVSKRPRGIIKKLKRVAA